MNIELPLRLRILSDPVNLPEIRLTTEQVCLSLGLDKACAGSVVLSVDEALANIIKHAYHGAVDKFIEIEYSTYGLPSEALQIVLRDYGTFVDPATIKSRDLADIRPGGLGVHIIKQCMDSMTFAPAEGGGTVLTLIKRITSGARK